VKVRPFQSADLPAAARLAVRLRAEDPSVEPFGDALQRLWNGPRARRLLWRLAELDGGELCGLLFALTRQAGDVDVYGAVAPARRQTGIGSRLLEPALGAAERDRLALHAQVREPSAGRAFLESHGFRLEGRTLLLERRADPPHRGPASIRALQIADRQDRELLLSLSAEAYAGLAEAFPLTSDDLDRFAPPAGLVLVAALDGPPAAYLAARTAAGTLAIEEIGTLPGARRRGLAGALLAEALARTGARVATLAVDEDNAAARAFYAAHRFAQVATRTRLWRPA
jgi:ribosomal protein S18 acetylase RimI-like enzyme